MSVPVQFREKSVWCLSGHITTGMFLYTYTVGVFNTCTDNVAASLSWTDSSKDYYIGLFSSLNLMGQTISCLFTAPAIDRIGRRKFLMCMDALYIIGTIILLIPNTACFGIGRLLLGIASGAMMHVCPVYIHEITPVPMMTKIAPFSFILENTSLILAYGFGLMLPYTNLPQNPLNELWMLLFLFPAVLSTYQLGYFCIYMKLDSPQFYKLKNRHSEAQSALELTHRHDSMPSGISRVNSDISGKTISGQAKSLFGMLFNRKFCKMIRIALGLGLIVELSGVTVINYYSTVILKKLGVSLLEARLITFITGIVFFISSFSSAFLLKYFGRKTIIIAAELLSVADLILIGVFAGDAEAHPMLLEGCMIAFYIPMGIGIETVIWTYASEVLNDQLMSVMMFVYSSSGFLEAYIYHIAAESVGIPATFFFFAACMGLGSLYSLIDLVETRDKTKEEILIEMNVIYRSVRSDPICSEVKVLELSDRAAPIPTEEESYFHLDNNRISIE